MAEGGKINFPPGKKKGEDEEWETSGGKRYPKGKMGKAEKRALLQAKREFGGIPPSEVAAPVETSLSEPVIEQTLVVGETPAQSVEVPPVVATEPEVGTVPQEPAPQEMPLEKGTTAKEPNSGGFNPDRMTTLSELAYKDIAEEVRKVGVNPSDLPAGVWEPANKAFSDLRNLIVEHKNESGLSSKKKIESKMRALRLGLKGEIRGNIRLAAQEYLKTHPVQTGETKVEAVASPKVAALEAVEAEVQRQIAENRRARSTGESTSVVQEEEPFDPHSVASVTTVEEQRARGEVQEGVVPGSLQTPDSGIDDSAVLAPQYGVELGEGVQEEMDALREGTPKENRARFLDVMARAKEVLGRQGERGARLGSYLAERLGKLDTAIAAETEGRFRWLGEKYGKLGLKSKIAIGLSLGIGMGVSAAAGASIPAALGLIGFGAGIGAQRIAGLSAMFLKYEKSVQDGKWKKEKAMGKAIAYTAGMTGAMLLLVEGVKEASEWLGSTMGHEPSVPDAPEPVPAEAVGSDTSLPVPEAGGATVPGDTSSATASSATAPAASIEAAAPAISSEASAISSIEVKATPGHGYEYMMKRLWEQLHERNIGLPANADPDSDLARLLAADEDSIDKVVHQIAADPKHQFFHADGSSVRIASDAHMTIGARGELFLSDAGHEYQVAPAHAPVTGMPSGPLVTGGAPIPHEVVPEATPEALDLYFGTQPAAQQEINPLTGLVDEQVPAPVETAVPHEQLPAPVETATPHPVEAATTQPEAPVPSAAAEVPHSIVNSFGVEVQTLQPHLYADSADRIFAYGGSPAEKMKVVLEYLTKNPDKIIYASDDNGEYRIPWHLADGKVVPAGAPVQTSGFFGFFKDFMKAPSPDEFEKIIK